MEEEIWYFAYGLNFDPSYFKKHVGNWIERKICFIKNHTIVFNKPSSNDDIYNIQKNYGSLIYGACYKIKKSLLFKIDIIEQYTSFKRYRLSEKCINVETNEIYNCIIYVAASNIIQNYIKHIEKKSYLRLLENDLSMIPKTYIDNLEKYIDNINQYYT